MSVNKQDSVQSGIKNYGLVTEVWDNKAYISSSWSYLLWKYTRWKFKDNNSKYGLEVFVTEKLVLAVELSYNLRI